MRATEDSAGPRGCMLSRGPGGVLADDNSHGGTYPPGYARRQGSTDLIMHGDWLGSTRYHSDSTGNAFPNALRFDAFGNRTATAGTPYDPIDLQFAGAAGYQTEYADAATNEPGVGLQYLQQRYYDPVIGRFISQDPIGFAGGLNPNGYAGSDPVGSVDPTGRDVYILTWGGSRGDGFKGTHAAIAVDWPGSQPKVFDFMPLAVPGADSPFTHTRGLVQPGRLDPATWGGTPSHGDVLPDAVFRVPTAKWQDRLIRRWLLGTATDDEGLGGAFGFYNWPFHQCSTYVRDALDAGRLLSRDSAGYIIGPGGEVAPIPPPLAGVIISPTDLRAWATVQPGARRLR